MILNVLNNLIKQAKLAIMQSDQIHTLNLVRIRFLGKNGYINKQFKKLQRIDSNIKPTVGAAINQAKKDIYNLLIEREKKIKSDTIEKSLITDVLDVTLPGRLSEIGTIHPITNTIEHAEKFFSTLGFKMIHGPEIENDYFNFDALNIPINHPARDEHDTFWFDTNNLLRTHTSGMQIRTLINTTLPIRMISVGRVYRKDYDKNHTPMFHQLEGLIVDINVSFSNLKKMLYDFLNYFFQKDIILRFRPSYFPFTEPSAEIDILEQQSKNWLELLGCGMVHPIVLKNVGINSEKFSGFAFGIGIERLTMLMYNINDIRVFFENDLQFLDQFQ